MKTSSLIVVGAAFMGFSQIAIASYADETTIRITGKTPGATPFISKLTLAVSNASVLKSIQFTITPKPGSVTRPLSGTYVNSYLVDRGFENPQTGEVVLPVYGLYDGYDNTVKLTCRFLDGSSKQINTGITTAAFNDTCGYKNPTILQRRTNNTDLSYDYMMLREDAAISNLPSSIRTAACDGWARPASPPVVPSSLIMQFMWVMAANCLESSSMAPSPSSNYSDLGIINFHHNIDPGKVGIILDADTTTYYNCVNIEVDAQEGL